MADSDGSPPHGAAGASCERAAAVERWVSSSLPFSQGKLDASEPAPGSDSQSNVVCDTGSCLPPTASSSCGPIVETIDIDLDDDQVRGVSCRSGTGDKAADIQATLDVSAPSVNDTVAAVVRALRAILPASEHESVEKKLNKYVNSLAAEYRHSVHLDNYIESRLGRINADQKNVYLHIRDILDELRKCRAEGRGATTSELSDTGLAQQVELVPVKLFRIVTVSR